MIEYIGAPLSVLLSRLGEIEQWLKPVKTGGMAGTGAEQVLGELLIQIEQECKKLEVPIELVQTIKDKLDFGSPPSAVAAFGQLSFLRETIEKSLQDRLFLFVPPQDAIHYKNPLARFPKTTHAFPSAQDDITAASRCYAVGLGTACVFHSMGVLQPGLYALANAVGANFDHYYASESWGKIIDLIEEAIGRLRKAKKSNEKDDQLNFYSQAATQFRYFKDAWRNYVSHLRKHYEPDEAFLVLSHVREFMEHLSSRVKEIDESEI
jgi:hypothetical protein